MTVHDTIPVRGTGPLAHIGSALARFFIHVSENSANARAAREAQRLFGLSDAELAKEGVARNQILHRAFGPRIWL